MRAGRAFEVPGLGLSLGLARISSLRPHEGLLEEDVRSLASSMAGEGVQLDPLMVDSATMVVLDGTHRLEALRRLGAIWAAVALVDYRDPGVRVGRWLRAVDPGAASAAAERAGMRRVGGWEEAMEEVDSSGRRAAVLMPSGPSYLGPESEGSLGAHLMAEPIWRASPHVELVRDDEVAKALGSGRAVVYPPTPRKEEVLAAAESGTLFPPRSTRHVFRARPLGLGVPLSELRSEEPSPEVLGRRASSFRRLPPGSVVRGRRYDEEVVEFT